MRHRDLSSPDGVPIIIENIQRAIETVRQVRLLLDCGFSTRQIYGFLPCFGEGENFDPVTCAGGARTVSCQAKRARSPDRSAEAKARRLSERIDCSCIPPSISHKKNRTR